MKGSMNHVKRQRRQTRLVTEGGQAFSGRNMRKVSVLWREMWPSTCSGFSNEKALYVCGVYYRGSGSGDMA